MKIAILSILADTHFVKLFAQEARRCSHVVDVINYLECSTNIDEGELSVTYEGKRLDSYDVVIPRIASGYSTFGLNVLGHFESSNTYCLNHSGAIRNSKDKFKALTILANNKLRVPHSTACFSKTSVEDQYQSFESSTVILKKNESTQGEGVFKVNSLKEIQFLMDQSDQSFFLQEYIEESRGEDIRVLVLGEKVIAYMLRQAPPGEFRSNLHLGGIAKQVEITQEEREMAIKAGQALDLKFAGVDILRSKSGPMLLEVNSAPGLKGLVEVGFNGLESQILDFIEKDLVKIID